MPILQFTLEIIQTLCGHLRPVTDSIFETVRGKHCRHPIAIMGVVDTFGHYNSAPRLKDPVLPALL